MSTPNEHIAAGFETPDIGPPNVLPWHMEAARGCCAAVQYFGDGPEAVSAIIARHDAAQHQETVRLLEEVTNHLHELIKDEYDDPSVGIVGWNGEHELVAVARAHLAAIKQPAAPAQNADLR